MGPDFPREVVSRPRRARHPGGRATPSTLPTGRPVAKPEPGPGRPDAPPDPDRARAYGRARGEAAPGLPVGAPAPRPKPSPSTYMPQGMISRSTRGDGEIGRSGTT